eukprot:CAMPEP_0174910166 /NCGR_PEP_ID=MMETSP0167-20121228/71810_1 /TAXON_ID=38298 /ORGANISM="Rhodella maculata, Strain CCMP736" /LENGTH=508 /DNA_ID=CAMNT_0016154353 /DNA_START=104 /DNA_END=1630 /DNA_ORIENTATION=-
MSKRSRKEILQSSASPSRAKKAHTSTPPLPLHLPLSVAELRLFRFSRTGLLGPALSSATEVCALLAGVQAQEKNACLVALFNRLVVPGERPKGSMAGALESQFFAQEEGVAPPLIRTWSCRHTLHLLCPADLPLAAAGMSAAMGSGAPGKLSLSEEEYAEAAEEAALLLKTSGGFLRKDEFSSHSWAANNPPKHPSLETLLCYTGPVHALIAQGRAVRLDTLATPGRITFAPLPLPGSDKVVRGKGIEKRGEGRETDGDSPLLALTLRYFSGYGPATLADLRHWSGLPAREARLQLDSLLADGRLVTLSRNFPSPEEEAGGIGGGSKTLASSHVIYYAPPGLAAAAAAFAARSPSLRPPSRVRLLHHFDPVVLAYAAKEEWFASPSSIKKVWKSAARVEGVVVDFGSGGLLVGIWNYTLKKSKGSSSFWVSAELFLGDDEGREIGAGSRRGKGKGKEAMGGRNCKRGGVPEPALAAAVVAEAERIGRDLFGAEDFLGVQWMEDLNKKT